MAKAIWRGDAQAVPQVDTISINAPSNGSASVYTVTINRKEIAITKVSGTAVATIATDLAAAIASSTLEEYLEVTASVGVGGTTVLLTGPDDGKPFVATVAESGAGDGSISIATTTTPTGPAWFSDPDNWVAGTVPVDGDDLVFEHSEADCLYGLAQSSLTPASISVRSSYTGNIGLPIHTGDYCEYRDAYLRIGSNADAQTIAIAIGEGPGSGSGRVKIDTGDARTNLVVYDTGSPSDSSAPAVLWKGTHASNTVKVYSGSAGIAFYAGELATVATLEQGMVDSGASTEATVTVGPGVTLGTVNKASGTLTTAGVTGTPITSLTNWAGETTIDGTDGVTALLVRGGTVYYCTSGTLGGAPLVSGQGTLDFSRDFRAKTVTNPIEVHGDDAAVNDPFKVVSSLVVDYNETTRLSGLGRHIRVTRGAVA